MVDITRDKPIKVNVRVQVPVRDHPKVSRTAIYFPLIIFLFHYSPIARSTHFPQIPNFSRFSRFSVLSHLYEIAETRGMSRNSILLAADFGLNSDTLPTQIRAKSNKDSVEHS